MNIATTPPPAPIVARGRGHELPDIFAARLVDQWLVRAFHDELKQHAHVSAAIKETPRVGGSPDAQRRYAGRLLKAFGPTVLGSSVLTGKRARFSIAFDLLHIGGALIPRDRDWDGTAPKAAHMRRYVLSKDGPNTRQQISGYIFTTITHHALVRLVQRGGAEKYEAFLTISKAAWRTLALAELATRGRRKASTLMLPFRMPLGPSDIGAFVMTEGLVEGDAYAPLLAKTFLSGRQLSDTQYATALDLLDALEVIDPASATDEQLASLLPLLDRCSAIIN